MPTEISESEYESPWVFHFQGFDPLRHTLLPLLEHLIPEVRTVLVLNCGIKARPLDSPKKLVHNQEALQSFLVVDVCTCLVAQFQQQEDYAVLEVSER